MTIFKSEYKPPKQDTLQPACMCAQRSTSSYLASSNVVEFLLPDFLGCLFVFKCDEYESSPLLSLGILGKLNGLNLEVTKKIKKSRVIFHLLFFKCKSTNVDTCGLFSSMKTNLCLTSPKVPKYSSMTSFEVSGLRPPTKIFLTGSFLMAIALFGSICRPSSLCSFCSRT